MTSISTRISAPINPHWQRASVAKPKSPKACHQSFQWSLTGPVLRVISALVAMLIAGGVLFWIGRSLINTAESVGNGHSSRLERELSN
jgi:hypothetical protein